MQQAPCPNILKTPTGDPVIVKVFLRGGIDQLHCLAPYDNPLYHAARSSTRIQPPGPNPDDAIYLTDTPENFGMPKAFAALENLFCKGYLAPFVQAGKLTSTHSHFESEVNVEHGDVDDVSVGTCELFDGWLARYLDHSPALATNGPRAISIGSHRPSSLQGTSESVLVTTNLQAYRVEGPQNDPRRTRYETAIDDAYASAGPPLDLAAADLFDQIAWLQSIDFAGYQPKGNADYRENESNFGKHLRDIAAIIRATTGDPTRGPEVYTLNHGGHDQHDDADLFDLAGDGAYGRIGLKNLADGLAAFMTDMLAGNQIPDVTLVVCSEFGRRVQENGSGGTDHGAGGLAMVFGHDVRGGRILGHWENMQTTPGGDLAVTTDLRLIFADVLTNKFGVTRTDIFPGCYDDSTYDSLYS